MRDFPFGYFRFDHFNVQNEIRKSLYCESTTFISTTFTWWLMKTNWNWEQQLKYKNKWKTWRKIVEKTVGSMVNEYLGSFQYNFWSKAAKLICIFWSHFRWICIFWKEDIPLNGMDFCCYYYCLFLSSLSRTIPALFSSIPRYIHISATRQYFSQNSKRTFDVKTKRKKKLNHRKHTKCIFEFSFFSSLHRR